MDSGRGSFTTMHRLLSIFLAIAATLTAADIRPLSGDRRIVGGDPATIEQHPYQVSIEINGKHHGSGSILSENFILTAGHVFPPTILPIKYMNIVAGVTDRSNQSRQIYKTSNWIPIPFPTRRNFRNNIDKDVGIIVLDTPIKFGPGVQPISLVTKEEHPKPGDMLTLSGWGSTQVGGRSVDSLRALRVPTLSQDTCRAAFSNSRTYVITDNMLCVGGSQEPKTAGPGDSGGPAVTDSKKLAGIISWGKVRDLAGSATVLTDVTSPPIADFIKAVLNGTISVETENARKKKRWDDLMKRREEQRDKLIKELAKKKEAERKKREEEKRRREEKEKSQTSKP